MSENTTRYAWRPNGPIHIVPATWHPTLCGRRVAQYVATRIVAARPAEDGEWCTECLRHEKNGTRKAWRKR